MKNDPLFKFVAAIVIVGVIVAFVGPPQRSPSIANSSPPPIAASRASE
jgi:hypothetical protein